MHSAGSSTASASGRFCGETPVRYRRNPVLEGSRAPCLSGFARFLRCGKDLRQLPEVLGGSGEEKFVVCAAWAT